MAVKKASDEQALRWRYTLRYLLAMGLVIGSISIGAVQVKHILEVNRLQAEVINIAGAQRMLSQRLALLPSRVAVESNQYRRDRALRDLRVGLDRMRDGHRFLTQGRDGVEPPADATDALRHHYAPVGRGLNNMVWSFIETYERYLEAPDTHIEGLAFQRMNAENELLIRLDQAVTLHVQAADARIGRAVDVNGFWVLISMALIFVVVAAVFRPMARDAAKAVALMSAQLDDRTSLLSRSLKIAKMGHWRASNPMADPIWMSQEILDLYGIERDEGLVSLSVLQDGDVLPEGTPIEQNAQHQAFKHTWESGEPTMARSQWRKPNGEIIDMLVHMEAELDDKGRVKAVVGVIKDDTAEAEADRALMNSYGVIEAKTRDLMEAQRLGKLATWRAPIDDETVEWDERTFELMRFDPTEFETTRASLRGLYVGDSHDRLEECHNHVLATGGRGTVDIQMIAGDGVILDIRLRITLEHDESGQPIAFFGTLQDISQERAAARELEQLAYYDNLTGLANRTLFARELKRVTEASAASGYEAALLLIDLDHFKEVNDTLGHEAGDQLLGIVGQRLASVMPSKNFVARLGGDEFAIIIEGSIERRLLNKLAKDVIDSMGVPAALSLGSVQTNASVGIAIAPFDSCDPDELMRFADLALYASKEKGRGRHSYYEEGYSIALGTRMTLANEIRSALDEKRFQAHYQPIVDLKSGRVSSFEALLRLPKADGGFVSPADFVPIAESSHLIADLGAFVLNEACSEAKSWVDAGLPPRTVSVNVSAAQVWHGDLEKVVDGALTQSGLDPHLLCVELTESVFAADSIDRLQGILTRLKARGIQLALDDFGTGYSSLGYLNRLPFDRLKIDRMFVSKAHLSAEKRKMLRGVVSLGKGLDLQVTAEGVEIEPELRLVRELGCDAVQGWFFSKALPGEQAAVEASRIDASQLIVPLDEAARQRKHHSVVMAELTKPRAAS